MLIKRVFTGIVLIFLMLLAVFYLPKTIWEIVTALIAGVALWEFCAMVKMQRLATYSYLFISALAAIACIHFDYRMTIAVQIIVLLFWLIVAPLWLAKRWVLKEGIVARLIGWLLIFPAWISLLQWRQMPNGEKSILSIIGIACVADIAAYCAGKAIGKHKLSLSISPGKTWEGAICGVFAAVVYVLIVNKLGYLPVELPITWLVLLAILLSSLSIVGDLLESWFKRCVSMKDSSNLLPGHGGIYDRIDGMLAVLAVSSAMFYVVPYLLHLLQQK